MSTRHTRPPRARRTAVAGYTLVAVLLAVAVMAGLVAAYGRHVIVAGRGGMASPQLLATREACHSGLAYARQALVAGTAAGTSSVPIGDAVATISVAETAGGHQLVTVESVGDDGLGARRTAELALQGVPVTSPSGPASLPTLSPATVTSLLGIGTLAITHYTSSARVEGADLSGLLVIHPGVELQLDDVVLHGAVISASVLEQEPLGAFDVELAPRLLVDGNLRIDPPEALPGLAILLPDGRVSSGAVDARVQIHGDVVAHDVSLLHEGSLEGHVMGIGVALADASVLDRLGIDRKPPEWSSALSLGGSSEPVFLATVPVSTTVGSLSAIVHYWQQD
jgi:hypothetical protein